MLYLTGSFRSDRPGSSSAPSPLGEPSCIHLKQGETVLDEIGTELPVVAAARRKTGPRGEQRVTLAPAARTREATAKLRILNALVR